MHSDQQHDLSDRQTCISAEVQFSVRQTGKPAIAAMCMRSEATERISFGCMSDFVLS